MITDETKKRIFETANIYDVVKEFETLKKAGASYYFKCPKCGAEGKSKGMSINREKNIAKCFSGGCEYTIRPVDYLTKHQNKTYPEALAFLAELYNITLETVHKEKAHVRKQPRESFCSRTLAESGIDADDITASLYVDEHTVNEVSVFESGTMDEYNNIVDGDDIIIHYYDLYGKPVTYQTKGSQKTRKFVRVRWQNPEAHPNKDGSIGKYKSPAGSGSPLFIPPRLRKTYNSGGMINTLYIQEGEKKAIKATRHAMFSVAISGIHNFIQSGSMPHEIQLIVQRCQVKNIVLMLDSDCFDLSNKLSYGSAVDYRPKTFYKSVLKFQSYVKTLYSLGLNVEIFFAHPVKNKNNEKGIDDILAGSLKNKELEFQRACDQAMLDPGYNSELVKFYNLASYTGYQLQELWCLHSPDKFAEKYIDILKTIPEFKINKIKYKIGEADKLEMAQPLQPNEMFWEEKWTKQGGRELSFKYSRCWNFLQNRGYARYMPASGDFIFVHVENKVVKQVQPWEIRDFVTNIAKGINDEDVLDMLYRGGPQYLGPDKLSNLDFVNPEFERAGRDFQLLFFKDKYWKITKDGIEEKNLIELENYIWNTKINKFNPTKIDEPLLEITSVDDMLKNLSGDAKKEYSQFKGKYIVKLTEKGQKSQFLRYMKNVSTFSWYKKENEITTEDKLEDYSHFMTKLWAFGYLLHTFFIRSKAKAVIAMDGKLSAIGESHGGTGKSILGFSIGHVIPQFYLDATKKDLADDKFIWDGLTENHDNVFIDDARGGYDFKAHFNQIEGRWEVVNKGQRRFTIPEDQTAKIYMTTNADISGEGNSYERRQFKIAFSDYYHKDFSPADEFGGDMFSNWSKEQWDLFINAAALCIQIFLKYENVSAPDRRLQLRRLRQYMGERFLFWADEYFGFDEDGNGPRVNTPFSRKEMTDAFLSSNPTERKFVNPNTFKKKVRCYCDYKDLKFNPIQQGKDDKRGGIEYFTIANDKFADL